MKRILLLTLCSSFIISQAQSISSETNSNIKKPIEPSNIIKIYSGDFAVRETDNDGKYFYSIFHLQDKLCYLI